MAQTNTIPYTKAANSSMGTNDGKYKVTVLTDDNLFDGIGYIHSWRAKLYNNYE